MALTKYCRNINEIVPNIDFGIEEYEESMKIITESKNKNEGVKL